MGNGRGLVIAVLVGEDPVSTDFDSSRIESNRVLWFDKCAHCEIEIHGYSLNFHPIWRPKVYANTQVTDKYIG